MQGGRAQLVSLARERPIVRLPFKPVFQIAPNIYVHENVKRESPYQSACEASSAQLPAGSNGIAVMAGVDGRVTSTAVTVSVALRAEVRPSVCVRRTDCTATCALTTGALECRR